MTPAENLLPRLDKVSQVIPGRWKARCPAHDDKNPSVRITETDDGTLLVKCWAGCTASEIVTAIGLEMRDLFPSCGETPRRTGPSHVAVMFERMVCRIGQSLVAQGTELSAEDCRRLELAQQRLKSLGGK